MNSPAWDKALLDALTSVTLPEAAEPAAYFEAASTPRPAPVIAQQFDQDILGDLSSAWSYFIESGQVWALIIGLVLGYLIRGLTAY